MPRFCFTLKRCLLTAKGGGRERSWHRRTQNQPWRCSSPRVSNHKCGLFVGFVTSIPFVCAADLKNDHGILMPCFHRAVFPMGRCYKYTFIQGLRSAGFCRSTRGSIVRACVFPFNFSLPDNTGFWHGISAIWISEKLQKMTSPGWSQAQVFFVFFCFFNKNSSTLYLGVCFEQVAWVQPHTRNLKGSPQLRSLDPVLCFCFFSPAQMSEEPLVLEEGSPGEVSDLPSTPWITSNPLYTKNV